MGETKQGPSGPDFKVGVPLADVIDGKALRGKCGDEDVMVVRTGGRIFAVSPGCTHYSGPLEDGLIDGATVRCPWHHACFSLETGASLRAPGLNPLTLWRVERRGDRVYVTGKAESAPPRARSKAGLPKSVVIVGGGAAGATAAVTLRREGFTGEVTILSADSDAPYDRPNCSKDYLAGKAPAEWMPLFGDDYYRDNGIELRLNTRVTGVDVRRKQVQAGGDTFAFDALLLATGATPIRVPVQGAPESAVFTLRSLADSKKIAAAAEGKKRALVLGASFIGLEAAWSLRERGLDVTVAAPEDTPLERVLGKELGTFLKALHEEHGVKFRLGRTAQSMLSGTVTLSDGSRVAADLIVMGVGVRPNLDLAVAAGLAVENGVLVDEYMATSAPGIWAVGDIARWPDPISGQRIRVEHWVVAERQGQVAARNILGDRRRYHSVPFFWSSHYDRQINYVGHAPKWDRVAIDGDFGSGDFRVDYFVGKRRVAVATVGRDTESLAAELELERAYT